MSQIESRPWGTFEVLLDASDCKVKRITVYPGQRLSLQYHEKRDELWQVISGKGLVTVGSIQTGLEVQDYILILRNEHHRIENTGDTNLVFIEIQTGEYFGEDDITRIEDDYGR